MQIKKHALLGMVLLIAATGLVATSEMLKTDAILISAKWTKEYVQWTDVTNVTTGPRGLLVKSTTDPETYGMARSLQQLPSTRNLLLSFGASGTGFLLAGFDDGSTDEEHAAYGITVANGKAQVRHGDNILTETTTVSKDRFQIELQRDRSRIVYRKNGKTFFMITEDTRKTLRVKAFIEAYQSALSNVAVGIQEEILTIPTATPTPSASALPSPTATPSPSSSPTSTPTSSASPSPTPTATPLPASPTPTPSGGIVGGVELPRTYLSSRVSDTPSTGQVRTVSVGGDLQAAINAAQPGDKIVLAAGATYTGVFTLPNKTGNSWITITTANFNVPEGKRVSPVDAPTMAKIITPTVEGAINAAPGAHHYRFTGVEISLAPGAVADANAGGATQYGLVRLGDSAETVLANLPHDFVFDRTYVHGSPTQNVRRGFNLNTGAITIVDSYVSDFHEIGADTQAILGANGTGPYKVVNNYIEAAGENLMVGGLDVPHQPEDFEIRNNYFYKPLKWMQGNPAYAGYPWVVKNLFETKYGRRWLIDGNVFENNWAMGQTGMAINMKSSNQDGNMSFAETSHVTFTNNIVRHAAWAVAIHGRDAYNGGSAVPINHVRIANNVFDDIRFGPVSSGAWGNDNAHAIQVDEAPYVTFDHNTIIHQDNSALVVFNTPTTNFTFTNNIIGLGLYGIKGDGTSSGTPTITQFLPGSVITKNAFVGTTGDPYPSGNFFPTSYSVVGFTNYNNGNGGNYALTSSSPYKNAGTDGKDLGADVDAVTRATACTISGACTGV